MCASTANARRLARLGLALALACAGCSSSEAKPADAGGDAAPDAAADRGPDRAAADVGADHGPAWANPLVPRKPLLPFPCDFFLVDDATTATGRRVEVPAAALPKNVKLEVFAGQDGFSVIPPILAHLPGGVSRASLPATPEATLAASSSVQLLREQTWERVPILAEVDLTVAEEPDRALIIRPLVALEPSTGYVVVLTAALQDPAGNAHAANAAFAALRDGTATDDPAIEKQRGDFELVNAAIAGAGLAPEDVVLAWSFHTRSEAQGTGTLLAMQQLVNSAPLGQLAIVSDTVEGTEPQKNRQIVATLKVPNFIGSDGLIARDAQGAPVQEGEREIEVGITIPSTVDGPRPVVLYGHGFLGHWSQGTRGAINELCQERRCSTVVSFFGFNDEIQNLVLTALASDVAKFRQVVAEVLQTFANYTALARLVKEQLAGSLTVDWGSGAIKPFDADRVQYAGISNGGTFGFVVAATSPQIDRANLIVGGGGLTHFLERSVVWNGYAPFVQILVPEALDRQIWISALQGLLDPIDSMSYARHLVHDRYPGLQPLRAAVHMAVNDSQVDNLVTEWVARTARIPLVTPAPKSIFGLQTVAAPAPAGAPADVPAVLFVYDEKVAPAPEGNIPPAEDNDTHGTACRLPAFKAQAGAFIEDGTLAQVCDGACDPD